MYFPELGYKIVDFNESGVIISFGFLELQKGAIN